jgi:hypothetical protein
LIDFEITEFFGAIATGASTALTSGRVGTRVEVEDDGAAAQVAEGDRIAVLVGEGEVGRGRPFVEHVGMLASPARPD